MKEETPPFGRLETGEREELAYKPATHIVTKQYVSWPSGFTTDLEAAEKFAESLLKFIGMAKALPAAKKYLEDNG